MWSRSSGSIVLRNGLSIIQLKMLFTLVTRQLVRLRAVPNPFKRALDILWVKHSVIRSIKRLAGTALPAHTPQRLANPTLFRALYFLIRFPYFICGINFSGKDGTVEQSCFVWTTKLSPFAQSLLKILEKLLDSTSWQKRCCAWTWFKH